MHLKDELNPRVAQRTWAVQRVAWAGMFAVLVLAVAGAFGTGLISRGTVRAGTDAYEVRVDYERWSRTNSSQQVDISISAEQAEGELSLVVSRAYADAISVQSIVPEPDSTSFARDGVRYAWQIDSWEDEANVSIEYQARSWGLLSADFTVDVGEAGEQDIGFTQIVYP